MLKRKNDRQPQSMEELYPDDYWLDEEDGEELPVPEMKRKPVSGRLHDEPMVTGYEALERQRGVRRPNRKLTRREKKALLLKEEQTAAYSVEIWKRFRKWGGIPTGITQNVKDLLASREIENIFENSDFILMLNQASGDRQILAKQLNISPHQLSYVTNSGEGEGLVFYGSTIIPFKDKFDNSLMLYALMTSKPDEVEKRKKLGIGERDD